jgi:hypothetical protein
MRVTAARLREIEPEQMSRYLSSAGWTRHAEWRDTASVWTHSEVAREILLPVRRSFEDYAVRVSQALVVLQELEQRRLSEIFFEIRFSNFDMVTVAINSSLVEPLPLDAAADFVRSAREMLLYAALSALNPRPTHGRGRKPKQIQEFIRSSVYVGGDIGQRQLRLIADHTLLNPTLHLYRNEPRSPVHMLDIALDALARRELEPSTEPEQIAAAVEKGVSSNLCSALLSLDRAGRGEGDVIISITLAPLGEAVSHRSRHTLRKPQLSAIGRWNDTLLLPTTSTRALPFTDPPRLSVAPLRQLRGRLTVRGEVVQLRRRGPTSGSIVLQLAPEDRGIAHQVNAVLSSEDYEAAVLSHLRQTTLVISGMLYTVGGERSAEMTEAEVER